MTARDGSVATQQQQPTATDSPVPHESQLKQIRDVSVNKTIPGGLFIACKSLHDKNIFDNFMTCLCTAILSCNYYIKLVVDSFVVYDFFCEAAELSSSSFNDNSLTRFICFYLEFYCRSPRRSFICDITISSLLDSPQSLRLTDSWWRQDISDDNEVRWKEQESTSRR